MNAHAAPTRRDDAVTESVGLAAADLRLPHTESGMTVGLFGGSFGKSVV